MSEEDLKDKPYKKIKTNTDSEMKKALKFNII